MPTLADVSPPAPPRSAGAPFAFVTLGAAALLAAAWLTAAAQRLDRAEEACRVRWAELETSAARLAALGPELADAVAWAPERSAADLERALAAPPPAVEAPPRDLPALVGRALALGAWTATLERLTFAGESDPLVSSTPRFRALTVTLREAEGAWSVSRERYDEAAAEYTATRGRAPGRWLAAAMPDRYPPHPRLGGQPGDRRPHVPGL